MLCRLIYWNQFITFELCHHTHRQTDTSDVSVSNSSSESVPLDILLLLLAHLTFINFVKSPLNEWMTVCWVCIKKLIARAIKRIYLPNIHKHVAMTCKEKVIHFLELKLKQTVSKCVATSFEFVLNCFNFLHLFPFFFRMIANNCLSLLCLVSFTSQELDTLFLIPET